MTAIAFVWALAVCGGCGWLRRWWLYISFDGVKQPWVRFRESLLEEHESEAVHIVDARFSFSCASTPITCASTSISKTLIYLSCGRRRRDGCRS